VKQVALGSLAARAQQLAEAEFAIDGAEHLVNVDAVEWTCAGPLLH
jgi:hypothetical protein